MLERLKTEYRIFIVWLNRERKTRTDELFGGFLVKRPGDLFPKPHSYFLDDFPTICTGKYYFWSDYRFDDNGWTLTARSIINPVHITITDKSLRKAIFTVIKRARIAERRFEMATPKHLTLRRWIDGFKDTKETR